VVQHGVLYVVGTVFQRGLGLLLLPFVTRVLGVEEFGLAATAAAVAALLAIVYGLGINFSIVRFFYDDPQDAARPGRCGRACSRTLAGTPPCRRRSCTGLRWPRRRPRRAYCGQRAVRLRSWSRR
jgi:hypothetical protein